jgi:hypothetical protein
LWCWLHPKFDVNVILLCVQSTKNIFTHTPNLSLYLFLPHPMHSFSHSPHSHPQTWKSGQYKVRDYLNVTTWANHQGWLLKQSFLLLALFKGTIS